MEYFLFILMFIQFEKRKLPSNLIVASWKNCAESAQIVCDLCVKSRKTSKLAQFHVNLEETISPGTNQDSLHPLIYGNISHFLVNSGSKQTSSIKKIAESASFLTKRGGG